MSKDEKSTPEYIREDVKRPNEEIVEKSPLLSKPVAIDMNPSGSKSTAVNSPAKIVHIRLEFVAIGDVDSVNEKYWAEVKIKSKWSHEGEVGEFDKKAWKLWQPKLYIENALDDKFKEEVTYAVEKDSDGKNSIVTETRLAKG
jgi:hypothetical protein